MPIYVYECPDCGTQEDRMRRIKDLNTPVWCGECGSELNLVPSSPAPFIRGSGSWSSPASKR